VEWEVEAGGAAEGAEETCGGGRVWDGTRGIGEAWRTSGGGWGGRTIGEGRGVRGGREIEEGCGAGRERGRRRRVEEDAMGEAEAASRGHRCDCGGCRGRARRKRWKQRREEKGGRLRAHPVGTWGECTVVLPAERSRGRTTERRYPYDISGVETWMLMR
jgi:hypothetical protein